MGSPLINKNLTLYIINYGKNNSLVFKVVAILTIKDFSIAMIESIKGFSFAFI